MRLSRFDLIHPFEPLFRVIGSFAHLTRVGLAPITINVLVVGALATKSTLTWPDSLDLALLGLFAHFFGFGLNDIVDLSIDRLNPRRQESPLVTGELPLWLAHLFVWIQFVLALAWASHLSIKGTTLLIVIPFGFSILLSIVYNLWSKRGLVSPFIAELGLSGAIGLLLLTGALTQSQSPNLPVCLLSLSAIFQHLLLNVLIGLTDIKTDQNAGAQSIAIWMGAKVIDGSYDDEIYFPTSLKFYTATLEFIIFLHSIVLVYLTIDLYSDWQSILILLLVLIFHICATLHLQHLFVDAPTFTTLRRSEPIIILLFNYAAGLLTLLIRAPLYFGVSILLSITYAVLRFWRKRLLVT